MRNACAVLLGVLAGLLPAADSSRTAFEVAAAITSAVAAPDDSRGPVTIVALDARTEAHPRLSDLPRSAWPRRIAPVVDGLLDAGAAAVAFDVVWPLAGADAGEWLATLRRGARDGRLVLGFLHDGERTIAPHPAQVAAVGGGARILPLNVPVDGGRVRMARAWFGEPPQPAMALALAARLGRTAPRVLARRGEAPLLHPALAARVRVISLSELLDCDDLAPVAAGRVMLFGAWQPYSDRHASVWRLQPAAARRVARLRCDGTEHQQAVDDPVPGALLHAVAVMTFAGDARLRRLPGAAEAGVYAVFAAVALRLRAVVACMLLACTLAASCWALTHGWVLPWAGASFATVTALACRTAGVVHRRMRNWMAGLPAAFREHPGRGELLDATVCFIDIERWTRRGVSADATSLASELSGCLGRMSEVIESHGGHVDKYLGDGLMALFGIDGRGAHAARAVAATRACFDACTRMEIAGNPVRLRAGIARGPVQVGDIGRDGRIHFTAIGDTVNVAARLEQLNRALGTRILVDEGVMSECPGGGWRACGTHTLRGRGEPLAVWADMQQ